MAEAASKLCLSPTRRRTININIDIHANTIMVNFQNSIDYNYAKYNIVLSVYTGDELWYPHTRTLTSF